MNHPSTKDETPAASYSLGFLGFGEAGQAFASGLRGDGTTATLRAFDLKTDNTQKIVTAAKWHDYAASEVTGCVSIAQALEGASVVFSMVTADQALAAAMAAVKVMKPDALYFDCNSCAPETKKAAASVLETANICYVDTAVMSPVHPALHKTPLLISGPHVEKSMAALTALGMNARVVSGGIGQASSIKMMRSVIIKGIEGLVLEGLLAARKAGVDKEVIASLDASFTGWDWTARAGYNLERTTKHGLRRAAEMREVAKTVDDLGLPSTMSRSIAAWQQRIGELELKATGTGFSALADTILAAMEEKA
ncbi:MAG: DUF1932 domain-containing protein [Paracoccaceae bacterium]